jgi:hypothetical protein
MLRRYREYPKASAPLANFLSPTGEQVILDRNPTILVSTIDDEDGFEIAHPYEGIFTPDGKKIIYESIRNQNSIIEVLDTATGKAKSIPKSARELVGENQQPWVLSKNGEVLVTKKDNNGVQPAELILWDLSNLKKLRSLTALISETENEIYKGQEAIVIEGGTWVVVNTPDNKYRLSIALLPGKDDQLLLTEMGIIIDSLRF